MRLQKLLIPTALMGMMAACASVPSEQSSHPEPVSGKDWHFSDDRGESMLAYGVANSDDLHLRFDCTNGSRRLTIIAEALGRQRVVHLESGGDTERYPADPYENEMDGNEWLTAEASSEDPVFKRFKTLGWIALLNDNERQVYAAHPLSEDRIKRFFNNCG